MTKQKNGRKKQERRTKKILFTTGLTAVVFVVATYAWFIGTMQASVDAFEIDIKSSDGLTLSLDGQDFSNQITIGEEEITTNLTSTYASNKNKWTGADGLIPVSTTGDLDQANSVLNLYSKTSISSSTGGYMLRADKIDNSTTEGDGYIAFDLFLKNKSGNGYEEDFDISHDEGVYLTTDSIMKMVESGGGDVVENAAGDGVQNSMRVAFIQIGRAEYNKEKDVFQGITCESVAEGVTTLCHKDPDSGDGRGYTWNIWEPNDTKHTTGSVSRFTRVCKKRTATDSYEGACDPITDDTAAATYAINSQITSDNKVNIFDGHNGYEGSNTYLKEVNYFTDTMKNTQDDARPEIFYLTPNSVTKIRVYIYIEGQDVDNYDIDTEGKKIKASFGFTKDKFDTAGME